MELMFALWFFGTCASFGSLLAADIYDSQNGHKEGIGWHFLFALFSWFAFGFIIAALLLGLHEESTEKKEPAK